EECPQKVRVCGLPRSSVTPSQGLLACLGRETRRRLGIHRTIRDNPTVVQPLAEQTILITGATGGLGRALASELAAKGATLLIHGRDDARGRKTLDEVRTRTGNERLHWLRADLASLDEVRALAQQVTREHDSLHAIVNNAGIGGTIAGDRRRMESRDGYELRFAVNYLAGYLLTRLVLPLLVDSAPARVVNVSSAEKGPVDFARVTRG